MEISWKEVKKIISNVNTRNVVSIELTNKEAVQEEIEATPKEEIVKETKEQKINNIWQIEIPKIGLIAPISEGTTQEVMLEYVGHFENTNIWNGNIGLAAHNRGYPINYFSKLKDLEIGDEIIYKTDWGSKKYLVEVITIIEDIDWSYLEESIDNRITLITCVENEPEKRRCIQGIEIKEE